MPDTASNPPRRPRKVRAPGLWCWHLWAGLAGLGVLLVAAVSGALLVYQKELVAAIVTPDASLPADYRHQQLAEELSALASQRGIDPALKLKAPSQLEPYWTVRHAEGLELLALGSLQPYTNNLWFLDVISFIRELHVDLLSGEIGEALLLVAGVLALFLCISGVILWWPGRRGFRWSWVLPKKLRPSQWLQYHRHTGAVSSPILLLILLTGSLMLWQKLIFPLLPPNPVFTVKSAEPQTPTSAISRGYLLAHREIDGSWPTYITIGREQGDVMLKVRFRLNGEWHLNGRTTVWLNTRSGELRRTERADNMPTTRRLLNQLYPLHSGFGMNTPYRLLTLLSGIALAWLCLTGGLHYYKRWQKRSAKAR